MALFRKKQDEDASALEKLVNSILFSGDVKLSFSVAGKDNKPFDSGFYLLPIEAHDQCIFGILEMDNELVETPLGFLHKYGFAHKHHYIPTMDGALMEVNYHNNFSFIPLKPTSIKPKVKSEDGAWKALQ